jgi:class 3 adenylate cyclase
MRSKTPHKMLRAIRDLGNVPVAVTAPLTPAVTEPTRRDDAERRQLTVIFTGLVCSTALSTKLDPEDMRFVIGAYHKCVAETVAGFDGFVAKYTGDEMLVYIGYPQAHEDDVERAVRARLALIEAVGKSSPRLPSDASRAAAACAMFSNWPVIRAWQRHSARSKVVPMRSAASPTSSRMRHLSNSE